MFAIRIAEKNDEEIILELWRQLIDYHRSIEAFRPGRWNRPPEEVIRPLLTAAWENPESRAAFVAEEEGRASGFVYTQLKEIGHCPANIDALLEAVSINTIGCIALFDRPAPIPIFTGVARIGRAKFGLQNLGSDRDGDRVL